MTQSKKLALLIIVFCSVLTFPEHSQGGDTHYVGSKACAECHEKEYANFSKYAKKAHSDQSVKLMASDLTRKELEGCYSCHTTGYGKAGGFVSYEETPELGHAGCEVCHGPGATHSEDGDPESITLRPSLESCEACHSDERVRTFNFKPMLFGGAH